MKKNSIVLAAIIVLALIVMSAAVILTNKPDSSLTTGTEADANMSETVDDPVTGEEPDAKIITFAVPGFCRIDDDNLQRFNDELIKDGHNYMLRIKRLEDDEYAVLVEGELKSGDTDIAFTGLGNGSGSNNIYNLLNSGNVLELDGILSQEQGKALYNAFPKNLWESVKCNEHIYSIPSTLADDQGVYAAFNRDYIADADIENWDGSIDGIYEIIKNVEWDNNDAPRFIYDINGYAFDDMIGCEINNGLLFDYESLSIEDPLESEKFLGYLKVLEQMKKDGYMTETVSFLENTGINSAAVRRQAEAGNYLVALSHGSVDEVFLKDNITVKKVTPYLSSRINGSIVISKNTDDIEAVVDFLSIFYGNGKYGNILLYGQEGTDYTVVDGVARNVDGTELNDDFFTKLSLNLFVNVHPVSGEKYMSDRKNEFFSFYDSVELSPFIGFEPDTTGLNNIANDVDSFMNSLRGKTVDEAALSARDKLKSDGIDEYLSSVKRQWEEHQQ